MFAYLIIFIQVLTVNLLVQDPLLGILVPEVEVGSAMACDETTLVTLTSASMVP